MMDMVRNCLKYLLHHFIKSLQNFIMVKNQSGTINILEYMESRPQKIDFKMALFGQTFQKKKFHVQCI